MNQTDHPWNLQRTVQSFAHNTYRIVKDLAPPDIDLDYFSNKALSKLVHGQTVETTISTNQTGFSIPGFPNDSHASSYQQINNVFKNGNLCLHFSGTTCKAMM